MTSTTNMATQTGTVVHRVVTTHGGSVTRCGRTVTAYWLDMPTAPVTCKWCNASIAKIQRELDDSAAEIAAADRVALAHAATARRDADHAAAIVEDDTRTYYGNTHAARILADKVERAHAAALLEDAERGGSAVLSTPDGLALVLASRIGAAPGGGTIGIRGDVLPTDGFMVGGHAGIPALKIDIPGGSFLARVFDAISGWARAHDVATRTTFVGWWVEDCVLYVDASTHVPDATVDSLGEAIALATDRGELAIYGLESGQCLDMSTRVWS